MKTQKILHSNWSYPIHEHHNELINNIDHIVTYLFLDKEFGEGKFQLLGMGASGATFLGALAMEINTNFVLLRKKTDRKYKNWSVKFTKHPIIIIDDHICEGRTLKLIAEQLKEEGVLELVTTVIARCWENDNPIYLDKGQQLMKELFPNIKLWLH